MDIPTQDNEGILSRLVILSSATAKIDTDPQSPFSPSERILAPLDDVNLSVDRGVAKFHTELSHPSLFAVAVRDTPGSIPLPLRCCLFVLYPLIENMVAGFDVEAYVGMNIPTVATVSSCDLIALYSHSCVFIVSLYGTYIVQSDSPPPPPPPPLITSEMCSYYVNCGAWNMCICRACYK